MTAAIARRDWLVVPPLALAAVLLGAAVSVAPGPVLGATALALTIVLAFAAPVAHLGLLLLLTVVVPFSAQNAVSGGAGAGLFPSDLMLATGLLRAAVLLVGRPLDGRRVAFAALCLVVLVGVLAQFAHGVVAGNDVSQAGGEARALLGFGTLLVALPILLDPGGRRRLQACLLLLGLALGLWGLAQWVLGIEFGGTGDVGVREGVSYTTTGRGQIQGGLYGFPVALLLACAVLVSPRRLTAAGRSAVLLVAVLNAICLLLTYERTFWLATAAGLAVVIIRAEGLQRLKAAAWTLAAVVVAAATLATLAPSVATAARERFLSLGQGSSDESVRYRLEESRHVVALVRQHPLTGSGLAAQVFWGRPWQQVPEQAFYYNHNGYLALAWKLGIPLAAVLVALIAWAVVARGPRGPTRPDARALRSGAQASLLTLSVASVTFPSFSTLAVSSAIGVLLALCATS